MSSQRLSEGDILKILSEEGVHIESPPIAEYTRGEIEHDGLEGLDEHAVRFLDSVEGVCESYLSGPLIRDSFATHPERRAWRNEIETKYGRAVTDVLNRNRLRLNNIGALHSYFTHIGMILGTRRDRTPKMNAILEVSKLTPDISRYDDMSVAEKAAVVSQFDEIAKKYLRIVHNDETHE